MKETAANVSGMRRDVDEALRDSSQLLARCFPYQQSAQHSACVRDHVMSKVASKVVSVCPCHAMKRHESDLSQRQKVLQNAITMGSGP